MEVVIQPTHCVLDSDMEVPERVFLRHLDTTPDKRIRPGENNQC
jgi:hypothetical protein